jgi:uncharacterized membrane protein
MSLLPADNVFALAAIIFGLAALGFWADRHPVAGKVSGVVWVLVTGMVLSNTGLIPLKSPVYGFVGQYVLPLGIPLLLYKANLRSIAAESGRVLPIFLLGAGGICMGAMLGFVLFDLGPLGPKVAAIYTGAWVGGMVNMVAISEALQLQSADYMIVLSASALPSVLALLTLASLPSIPWVRRHFPSRIIDERNAPDALAEADSEDPHFRLSHVAGALSLSFAICAVSKLIADWLGIGSYMLFVVTVVTVLLANVVPRAMARLQGDFELGMLTMFMFFAIVGAGSDALAFVRTAPLFLLYGLLIITVHFVFVLLCVKVFRFDLAEAIIASGANVVGPAATAALASAKGWKDLITPGITTGMLGYVIANFIGLAIFKILS